MATFASASLKPFLCLSRPSKLHFLSLQNPDQKLLSSNNNRQTFPLRLFLPYQPQFAAMRKKSTVCHSSIHPETLQWVCSVSSVVLMLVRGTAIQKSFLVPLFALQAPPTVISWIRGEYGTWAALLALLVRLFYFIPGELELPFLAMLVVIVAPHQSMNLRGTQAGNIISLVIAAYLAFQHFSGVGRLQGAFEQGSIVSTIAIICMACIPCVLLF